MALEITNKQEIVDKRKLGDSMAKFGGAMKELVNKSTQQTKILSSMLSNQVRDAYEKRRQDRLDAVKKDDKESIPYRLVGGAGAIGALGSKMMGNMGNFADLAMSTIFKGASLAVIAPIVAETVKNLLTVTLEEIGVSSEFTKKFGGSVSKAIGWGAVGMLLGRKFGLLLGAGSFIWDQLDDAFDIGDRVKEITGQFAGEWTDSIINGVGVASSAGVLMLMPKVLKQGLGLAFSAASMSYDLIRSIASAATPIVKGSLSTAIKRGVPLAMRFLPIAASAGIVALYYEYGDSASKWLSEQTGVDQNWTDAAVTTTSYAAAGATLGMMFGPGGAIVGGIIGLVAGLGHSVWKWFKRREEQAKEKAAEEMKQTDAKIKALDTSVNPNTGTNDNLERNIDSRAVAGGVTSFVAMQGLAKDHSPHDIAVQTDQSSERGARMGIQAVELATKSLSENYSGTEEENVEIIKAMHALRSMKQQYDEAKKDKSGIELAEQFGQGYEGRLKFAYRNMANLARKNIAEEDLINQIGENYKTLPEFRKGTLGFQDFGTESVALLHGKEAVVPENTDAAAFLKKYFNDDWSSKFSEIQNNNTNNIRTRITSAPENTPATTSVVYAPTTIAPTNNVMGGSNVNNSRITAIGGNMDLDFGLPRGAL